MANSSNEHTLVRNWFQQSWWLYLLAPFSLLYFFIISLRRGAFTFGLLSSFKPSVPTIVVGNITVGGAGKTPVVIALVKVLTQQGFKPGVISRGYGSKAPYYPYAVTASSPAQESGDEPLLIARETAVPVVIDANRQQAVTSLLDQYECDVIISDDGLQHYALQRDIEIAVVDIKRGFGSGWLMPVGPLRELRSRLGKVDFIIGNGQGQLPQATHTPFYSMQLQAQSLQAMDSEAVVAVNDWSQSKRVHAVAGIGHPERFFSTLRELGFDPVEHAFADHHHYSAGDFHFSESLPIIMTAKDAVKVTGAHAPNNSWVLPVEAGIDAAFFDSMVKQINALA